MQLTWYSHINPQKTVEIARYVAEHAENGEQSFLDEYDLSGKTIYLSVTHGGSRSAGIEREIAAAEPNATVSRNMLVLSRSDTAKSEQKIKDWAKGCKGE